MDEDRGRRAPSEARLQLARRPFITGVGSSHAFFAASASLNVTCNGRYGHNSNQYKLDRWNLLNPSRLALRYKMRYNVGPIIFFDFGPTFHHRSHSTYPLLVGRVMVHFLFVILLH